MVEAKAGLQANPNILERVHVVNRREGGLIEAYVPIDMIYTEDVPVDDEHVRELAASIQNETQSNTKHTGQLSPVLLANVEDLDSFPIIDGFHRVPALKSLGRKEVFATIRPDSSWEEVIDLRILSARMHKSVKFSRLIAWIKDAWEYSDWAEKITATQAFRLGFVKNMTGSGLGLSQEEAADVREWVNRKCAQWKISATTIHNDLSVAQIADPDLVKEVRERKSGHRLEALTAQHLSAIAKILPYKYPVQELVAKAAKDKALTVPMTRALALSVSKIDKTDDIRRHIASDEWMNLEPARYPDHKNSRSRETRLKKETAETTETTNLIDMLYEDEVEIARLSMEVAVLTGRYNPNREEPQSVSQEPQGSEIDEDKLIPETEVVVNPLSPAEVEELFLRIDTMRPALMRFLTSKQLGVHDAEDVISDMVVRINKLANEGRIGEEYLNDEDRFKALVVQAVKYSRGDWYRKELGRRRQIPQPKLLSAIEERSISHDANLGYDERGYEEADEKDNNCLRLIKSALPHLSKSQRQTIVLKALFNLSSEDVAKILAVSPSRVSQVLTQARGKMRQVFVSEQNFPDFLFEG